MQFSPSLHQPSFLCRKIAADNFECFNTEYGRIVLIIGMKVWLMVWGARFSIHADNNTEETTKFRHKNWNDFTSNHARFCKTVAQRLALLAAGFRTCPKTRLVPRRPVHALLACDCFATTQLL